MGLRLRKSDVSSRLDVLPRSRSYCIFSQIAPYTSYTGCFVPTPPSRPVTGSARRWHIYFAFCFWECHESQSINKLRFIVLHSTPVSRHRAASCIHHRIAIASPSRSHSFSNLFTRSRPQLPRRVTPIGITGDVLKREQERTSLGKLPDRFRKFQVLTGDPSKFAEIRRNLTRSHRDPSETMEDRIQIQQGAETG